MKMKDVYGNQYQIEEANQAFRLDSPDAQDIITRFLPENHRVDSNECAYVMARSYFYGDEYHFYNYLERSLSDAGLKYVVYGRVLMLSEEAATYLVMRDTIQLVHQ